MTWTRRVTVNAPAHLLNDQIAAVLAEHPDEEVTSITYLSDTKALIEFRSRR